MQRSTLVATLVFVGLGLLAGLVLTRKPERGITRITFANLEPDAVTSIEIAGPKPVQLHREEGVWRLSNGREADGDKIGNVLGAARAIVSSDILTQDKDHFADFGVDAAAGHSVTLRGKQAVLAQFVVGKSMANGAAVRVDDATYMVSNLYGDSFGLSENEWLQRRPFKKSAEDVARLEVDLRNQGKYVLQSNEGSWKLQPGDAAASKGLRFDPEAARMLVMTLMQLQVDEILDKDPGDAITGLQPEQADRLAIAFKTAEASAENAADLGISETLLLGKARAEHGGFYGRLLGRHDVYVLGDGVVQALRKKVVDLRDLTLMRPFTLADARTLQVQQPKGTLVLQRASAEASWEIKAGTKQSKAAELDPTKVSRRVGLLSASRAVGLSAQPALARATFKKPQGSVQVRLADGSNHTLQVGGPAKEIAGTFYAKGSADDLIYCITASLKDQLLGLAPSFSRDTAPALGGMGGSLEGLPPQLRKNLEQQLARQGVKGQLINPAATQH